MKKIIILIVCLSIYLLFCLFYYSFNDKNEFVDKPNKVVSEETNILYKNNHVKVSINRNSKTQWDCKRNNDSSMGVIECRVIGSND